MNRYGRARRPAALLAVAIVSATVLTACSGAESQVRKSVEAFLASWQDGSVPGHQKRYDELTAGLGQRTPKLNLTGVDVDDNRASASVNVAWTLSPGVRWSYDTTVSLVKADESWQVRFEPSTVHPALAAGGNLVLRQGGSVRAPILAGDGDPITRQRPVVVVGVHPARVESAEKLAAELGEALRPEGIDTSDLPERIEAADKDAFVKVVTLRKQRYLEIRPVVHPIPGTVFREETRVLAPTRQFARALLGTVGPVTREDIERSDGRFAAGDTKGHGGLQARYDDRLRGKPKITVLVRREQSTGKALFSSPAEPGKPVRTTLDPAVQRAADTALAESGKKAAIVAVDVPSGKVFAVGNSPSAGMRNLALHARVAPGSTFKMVTALSLLNTGAVGIDSPVPCPTATTMQGYTFKNAWDGGISDATFREAFARSCNTAFVSLSKKLAPDALATTARKLGIAEKWGVGVPVFTGSVPSGGSPVQQAAAAFGQGKTQVSPMSMAAATAAVARGRWQQPSLVTKPAAAKPAPDGPKLERKSLSQLRTMMREVVTSGTATSLRDAPGGPVSGKTGTAEYGSEQPPRSHSWFVGSRGDLAFAVFVHDGGNDGSMALQVTERFLHAL